MSQADLPGHARGDIQAQYRDDGNKGEIEEGVKILNECITEEEKDMGLA